MSPPQSPSQSSAQPPGQSQPQLQAQNQAQSPAQTPAQSSAHNPAQPPAPPPHQSPPAIARHPAPGQPLITVVLVVRNALSTLQTALESVFRQDRSLVECIVIDGASTDGTVDLLHRLSSSLDHWQSEPDLGIYDAMNKGAQLARGRFLYFLGADDVLVTDLARLQPHLTDPACIYFGDVLWSHPSRIYGGPFSAWRLSRQNICHQAIFYPTPVVQQQQFSLKYRLLADYELNLRCHADKRLRFQYLPGVIALYDSRGLTATRRDDAFERDRSFLVRQYLPRPVYLVHLLRKRLGRPLRRLWQTQFRPT